MSIKSNLEMFMFLFLKYTLHNVLTGISRGRPRRIDRSIHDTTDIVLLPTWDHAVNYDF